MKCVVTGCSNENQGNYLKFSFFRIPKNPKKANKWRAILKGKTRKFDAHGRVCEKHFTKSSITVCGNVKKLAMDAVPSIFDELENEESQIIETETATIREYIEKLTACSEFLSKSVTCIINEFMMLHSNSYKAPSKEKINLIFKLMRKIYEAARDQLHDIGTTLPNECNTDTPPADDSTVTLPSLPPNELSSQLENDSNQSNNGNGNTDVIKSKIRLVALEKLMDPNIMARLAIDSNNVSANCTPASTEPPAPCSSVLILDSDEEMDIPQTTIPVGNIIAEKENSTVKLAEQVPSIKLKIVVGQNHVREALGNVQEVNAPELTNTTENNQSTNEIAEKETSTVEHAEHVFRVYKNCKIQIDRRPVLEEMIQTGKRKIRVSEFLSTSAECAQNHDQNHDYSDYSPSDDDESNVRLSSDEESDYPGIISYKLRKKTTTDGIVITLRPHSPPRDLRRIANKCNYAEPESEEETDEDCYLPIPSASKRPSRPKRSDDINSRDGCSEPKRSHNSKESSSSEDEALISLKHKIIDGDIGQKQVQSDEPNGLVDIIQGNDESSSSEDETLISIKRKICSVDE